MILPVPLSPKMPSVLYKKKNLVDLPPDSLKTYTVNVVYKELNGRKKRKGDAGKSEVCVYSLSCPVTANMARDASDREGS